MLVFSRKLLISDFSYHTGTRLQSGVINMQNQKNQKVHENNIVVYT